MISTCPKCLHEVSHEDHAFEVSCECGATFATLPTNLSHAAPSVLSEPQPARATFLESEDAFREIQEFGSELLVKKDTGDPE